MPGRGGSGCRCIAIFGFDPDPALDEIGMFDLICGRPYCNLSREPRMQYRNMPLEHNFAQLKKTRRRALYPQATLQLQGKSPAAFFVLHPCAGQTLRRGVPGPNSGVAAHLRGRIEFEKKSCRRFWPR